MHPGIFNGPESTRVSSDADSMNEQFRERIENTSGFEVRTWLDAFLELEQYLGSNWWRVSSTREQTRTQIEKRSLALTG